MRTTEVPLPLSEEEIRLVAVWRELPRAPLQARVREIVFELLRFARDPHCDEMQADGAPCGEAVNRCEECAKVTEIFRTFERRVVPIRAAPDEPAPTLEVEVEPW